VTELNHIIPVNPKPWNSALLGGQYYGRCAQTKGVIFGEVD
jgi:DNA-directed RNA polymerase